VVSEPNKFTWILRLILALCWMRLTKGLNQSYHCRFYSMLDHLIIPLVSNAQVNYAKGAPPHSVINALDFPFCSFSAYVLGSFERQSSSLLWVLRIWKKYFKVRKNDEGLLAMNHMCSLCTALHDYVNHPFGYSQPEEYESYQGFLNWWIRKSVCTRIEEFVIVEKATIFPFLK